MLTLASPSVRASSPSVPGRSSCRHQHLALVGDSHLRVLHRAAGGRGLRVVNEDVDDPSSLAGEAHIPWMFTPTGRSPGRAAPARRADPGGLRSDPWASRLRSGVYQQGLASVAGGVRLALAWGRWPIASPPRRAPTSSSTRTTRSTGTPGATRRSERARGEDRPILLSIGYSACHWCHVMERESFEDPETAAYMNEHFVRIKVDREERPDVDSIYMEAVQGMTGHGGWPLTAFLDPEGVPFYGGTYFPPEPRPGHAELPHGDGGGGRVVEHPARADPRLGRSRIREQLGAIGRIEPCDEPLSPEIARRRGRPAADAGRHAPRRLRGGAEVPARLRPRAPARPRRRRTWSSSRSTPWRTAGSTTRSAAASPATRSTTPGSSPTSRRCSTTTPCSPAPTCTPGRRWATSAGAGCARRRSTGRCARCAARRAASTPRSTPTPRARRAASTSGPRTRSARRSRRPASATWPTR